MGIAIPGSVLGTSLVVRVLGHAAVSVHGNKVQSAVQSAREIGDIDVKGEFPVQELEDLIGLVVLQQVETRSNVRPGDKIEPQLAAGRSHAVGALVIRAVQRTILGAGDVVRAVRWVPGVARVAVGVAPDIVHPTPVRIKNDRTVLGCAAPRSGALLPCQGRVVLRSRRASLLCFDSKDGRRG